MSDKNESPLVGPPPRFIKEGSDKPTTRPPSKPAVSLRPREAVMNQRKAEIVRAMRDAAEVKQPIELAWVEELAEIIGVDLRRR